MLLSDLAKTNLPVFFVRFSQKSYLEELQRGKLYMNNLKYFIEEEERTGIKGVGDKFEAAHVLNDVEIKMYDSETNKLLTTAKASSITFRDNSYLYKPTLCLFALWSDCFEVTGEDEETIYARLVFTDEQKEKIMQHFGDHSLVIPAIPFLNQVNEQFKIHDIDHVEGLVEYSDLNINESKRIEKYQRQTYEIAFIKDLSFEYQKEFRILLTNRDVEDHFETNIGEIDGSTLLTTESLLNGSFELRVKKEAIQNLNN